MSYTPMQLAEAFIHAGELDDALHTLNGHLTQNPADDTARRLRVAVQLRLNDPSHLRAALADHAALQLPTAQDHYTRSVILERTDHLIAALNTARITLQHADKDFEPRAAERLLHLLHKSGDTAAALDLALEREWLGRAADLAAELDDPHAAIPHYTQALDRAATLDEIVSPEIAANTRARLLLGRAAAYLSAGELALADADYAAAAEVIPDDPMITFNRAEIAVRQGETDTAAQLLEQAHSDANGTLRAMMRDAVQSVPSLKLLWENLVGP